VSHGHKHNLRPISLLIFHRRNNFLPLDHNN
jgi:hypothetical protein